MQYLIYSIMWMIENIQDCIHKDGYLIGFIKSLKVTCLVLFFVFFMIGLPFYIINFIFFSFSPTAKYRGILEYAMGIVGDTGEIIAVLIIEIGLYLFSVIPLLNKKSKKRFMALFCATFLTLSGIFIGFNDVEKYCYFNNKQCSIVARYGLLSKEISYKPSDIDFVRISNKITYIEEASHRSTIITGPYHYCNYKIYLKDNECLEMEEIKLKDYNYLYNYLTANNVRIVNEAL